MHRFIPPGRLGPPNPLAAAWYVVHLRFALSMLLMFDLPDDLPDELP